MKFTYVLYTAILTAVAPVWAVYAPIPEQEQGKDLTVSVRAGYSYDSNIFGAPKLAGAPEALAPISSNVWEIAPRLSYNHSFTQQTFFSASYGLVLDEIENRPGSKLLDSHDLTLRLAHAFNQESNVDVSDVLMIARNPESLLNGIPANTDQSFTRNQIDGRYVTPITGKAGIEVKARSVDYKFRNAALGRSLDRVENLFGLAGNYAVLPEVKAIAEYRHLDEYYWKQGEDKNKNSNYLMGGIDYDVAKKLTLTSRVGAEWRHRAREASATAPYVELSGRYQYAEQSFVTGGYAYTFDEPSDTVRFTDQKVNRYFVNIQHAVTALIVASASVDYEPAVLQARRSLTPAVANLNETATRAGLALSYLPTKNWIISANYDFDRVRSDEVSRSTERRRVGVNASYTF